MENFKSSTWKLISLIYDDYFKIKTTMMSCETTTQMKVARDFYQNVRKKWCCMLVEEEEKYFWRFNKTKVSDKILSQIYRNDDDFDKLFDEHLDYCKYDCE